MKRRYQIDQQRAVQQFRQLAGEANPGVQMIFPMAESWEFCQKESASHPLRKAGFNPAHTDFIHFVRQRLIE